MLAGHRWSDHLTEDAELQLELLDDGVKVAFAPRARVDAEMPSTTEAARTQHERWERGRVELARRYVPGLLACAARGGPAGRVAYADAALDMAVPPFSVVVAGSAAWASWAALRFTVSGGRRARRDPRHERWRARRPGRVRPLSTPDGRRAGRCVPIAGEGTADGRVEGAALAAHGPSPDRGHVAPDRGNTPALAHAGAGVTRSGDLR